MLKKNRNANAAKNRKTQAEGLDISDWRTIVGRHSIMLALEPRFMFDGAGAEAADPTADSGGPDGGDGQDGSGQAPDASTEGAETVNVFSTGFDVSILSGGDEWEDPDPVEELTLSIADTISGGVSLNEDGSLLIEGVSLTGGDGDDYVKVEISLGGSETGAIDFDYGANYFDNTDWSTPEARAQNIVFDPVTGDVTITGTRDLVNMLLETLTYEGAKDAYTSDAVNGEDAPDTITITVYACDDGGTPIAVPIANESIDVTVHEVNDPTAIEVPTVDGVPIAQLNGSEDVPLSINGYIREVLTGTAENPGPGLALIDPDADELDVRITIQFELGDNWGDLSCDDANGSWTDLGGGKYSYTGTLDEVQAALDSLVYASPAEDYGNETLKITVFDGRTPAADAATVTLSIKITEVNDAPVFGDSPTANFLAMTGVDEGSSVRFTADMFNLEDIDNSDAHLVITINEFPTHGTILKRLNPTSDIYVPVTEFTFQDVLDGLIYYQHGGGQVRSDGGAGDNFHDADSFTFSVNDGAGGFLNTDDPATKPVDQGGAESPKSVHTFNISLKSVNQDPAVSGDPGNAAVPGGEAAPPAGMTIYEGEKEIVVTFVIEDVDQLKANDYKIVITDIGDLDGVLYFEGVPVTVGQQIDYADILAGKLRFTHDGSAGQDGFSGTTGVPRDTGFDFRVVDDGGGTGVRAEVDAEFTFTVLANNDNPYFDNNLTTDSDGVTTIDGAQVGKGIGESDPDGWLIRLGGALGQGGFSVSDVDSSSKDITYTIVAGDIWIWAGVDTYIQLNVGDSFTQEQIDKGVVYFHTTTRDTLTNTEIKVTVRDGSLNAWDNVVHEGADIRDDNGELVVQNGNEGAVGSYVPVDGGYVWTPTVITIPVSYYVVSGDYIPPTTVDPMFLGADEPGSLAVLEGQEVRLSADTLTSYYIYANGDKVTDTALVADPETVLYRLETSLEHGALWLKDEHGNYVRQINQYDSFSQKALNDGLVVYLHGGSENFSESFEVSVTDGSINLTESPSSTTIKKLTVDIAVTPGNDTPSVSTGELNVVEGAEAHQIADGETGFDRNGSVITAGNIGISDPDGNGDASQAGSDYKSSDTDITIVVQEPGYGSIWVWVGSDAALASSNATLNANPEMSLEDYNDKHGDAGNYWLQLDGGDYAVDDGSYSNADTARHITYALLKAGGVRYVHDGRDPSFVGDGSDDAYRGGSLSDTLNFRVYDGKGFEENDAYDGSNADWTGIPYHHQSWTDGSLDIKVTNVNDKPRDIHEGNAAEFHTPESANQDPAYAGQGNIASPDTGSVITSAHLNYTDAEKSPASLQYYIEEPPVNGTLYLFNGANWITIGQGAKFTQADIDAGNVKYVHNGTETHSDSFTWTLRDGDENSAKWVQNGVFGIIVDPTNNAPEIAVDTDAAKQNPADRYVYLTPDDVANGKDLGGVFTVSDRDYTDITGAGIRDDLLEATLTSTRPDGGGGTEGFGDLFINITAGDLAKLGNLVIIINGVEKTAAELVGEGKNFSHDEIVLKGTLDEINAALDLLRYIPDVETINSSVTIALSVNDLANGDVDGTYTQYSRDAFDTMYMYVNSNNTKPAVNGLPGENGDALTVPEDGSIKIQIDVSGSMAWLEFVDADEMDSWTKNELTFTVANGTLSFTEAAGATITSRVVNGERVYTITGSVNAVNAALVDMTYRPDLDYNGTETVKVTFNDHVLENPAATDIFSGQFDITVTPLNDAPVLTGTDETLIVEAATDNEIGGLLNIAIDDAKDTTGLASTNADNANRDRDLTVTLTITRTDGAGGAADALQLDTTGFTGTVVNNGTTTITITGKEGAINTLLASLEFHPDVAEGVYNLNVHVNDNENGGDEGDAGIVTKDFTLVIGSGDTTPQIGGNNIIIDEDTPSTVDDSAVTDLNITVRSMYSSEAGLTDQMRVELSLVEYSGDGSSTAAGNGALSVDATGATVRTLANGNTIITFTDINGTTEVRITSGGKTVSIVGTEAGVNAALKKLTYTPATHDNAVSGDATTPYIDTVNITVTDKPYLTGYDGSMIETKSVHISVTPVNDAPTLSNGAAVTLPAVVEDVADAANTGKTVSELFGGIGGKFVDIKDTVTGGSTADNLAGVIVTASAATAAQGTWQYYDPQYDNGDGTYGAWQDIPSGSGQSIYLGANVPIRFNPAENFNGTPGVLTVRLVDDSAYESHNAQHDAVPGQDMAGANLAGIYQDDIGWYIDTGYSYAVPADPDTGNANTSRYSDATVNLTTGVTKVNDAPVVNSNADVDIAVREDTAEAGQTVTYLFGSYFSDPNDANRTAGADTMAGIVVVNVDNSMGAWQYNTGSGWINIPATVADGGSGLYLANDALIRFLPDTAANEHYNGDPSSLIEVRLVENDANNDATAATFTNGTLVGVASVGGTTRISGGDAITANVTVIAMNDAPVVQNPGAAVTLPTLAEDAVLSADDTDGYLIKDLFDKTDGSQNDKYDDSKDDEGDTSADAFAGILVVGNSADAATQGDWEYWNGTVWVSIGTRVETGSDATDLLYLGADTKIRFQPAENFNGIPPELEVRLVDSSGIDLVNNPSNLALPTTGLFATVVNNGAYAVGDTTRYSADKVKVTVSVTARNDAPIASGTGADVSVAEDDDDNAGVTVDSLFGGNFSDAKDAQTANGGSGASTANVFDGVVVKTAADGAHGEWEYWTGADWVSINDALVSADPDEGLFLAAGTKVRFSPKANDGADDHFYGNPAASLTVHLVETKTDAADTSFAVNGAIVSIAAADIGGATRVSSATVTSAAKITAVNDAPTIAAGKEGVVVTVDAYEDLETDAVDAKSVGDLFGDHYADANDTLINNNGDAMIGVVVVAVDNNQGVWQYHNGTAWVAITGNGLYLDNDTPIRFLPTTANFNGDPSSTIQVRLVEDNSYNDATGDANAYATGSTYDVGSGKVGGDTRIGGDIVTAKAFVKPVNDAPVVENPNAAVALPSLAEDTALSADDTDGYLIKDLFDKTDGSQNDKYGDPTDAAGASGGDAFAGILVVGNSADAATQGAWQYWNGTAWVDIGERVETGADATDLLYLGADTKIRFQPVENFNGTPPALEVRLADDSAEDLVNNPSNPALPTTGLFATVANDGAYTVGDTTRYSADKVKVTVSVTARNDAPIAGGAGADVTVDEDDADNAGVTVDSLFGGNFSDAKDGQTANGGSGASAANVFDGVVVKTAADGAHGEWEYWTGAAWVSINDALAAADPDEGLFLAAGTKIRFSPKVDDGNSGYTRDHFNGDPAASLVVHLVETATDNSAFATTGSIVSIAAADTGGITRVSSATVTSKAMIAAVNDAPTIADGKEGVAVTVEAYEDLETAKTDAKSVSHYFGGYFADANDTGRTNGDDAMIGVAVAAVDNRQGTWQYYDEASTSWRSITVGAYLANDALIRFLPTAADFNGDPSSTIQVRLVENDANATPDAAADGNTYTTGSIIDVGASKVGGAARIGGDLITAKAFVNAVNDAPTVDGATAGGSITIPLDSNGIAEDTAFASTDPKSSGYSVRDLLENLFADPTDDRSATAGGSGSDDFAGILVVGNSADAATQGAWEYWNGAAWVSIGARVETGAGATDLLYLGADTAIRFNPAENFNGAPPALEIRLADDSAVDLANNPSNLAPPTAGLFATVANDGAYAVGDTTRYSAETVKVTAKVNAVNDAPVAGGAPSDVVVDEDAADNTGVRVEDVFGAAFTDPKDAQTANGGSGASAANSFAGVVVTAAADGAHGEWEYWTGSAWASINDALAAIEAEALANSDTDPYGLYLAAGTKVRFSPNAGDDFNGNPAASLTAHLVETDTANTAFAGTGSAVNIHADNIGGTTRVSGNTAVAEAVITAVNDAPVRDGADAITESTRDMTEDGSVDAYYQNTVKNIFENSFNDDKDAQNGGGNTAGSASNSFDGIIVTGMNASADGVWEYKNAGNEWVAITNNMYLDAATEIRFVPNTGTFNYDNGDATASLTVRPVETVAVAGDPAAGSAYTQGQIVSAATLDANDATGTASHSNAANAVTLTFDIAKTNNAPTLGGIFDTSGNEQTPIQLAAGGTIGDAELAKLGNGAGNWNDAGLTVERIDNEAPAPSSAIDVFGVVAGNVELRANGTVWVDGAQIGTYASSNGTLSMTFNSSATTAAVKEVLNSLTYTYNDDCPPAGDITLRYTINDGNAGTQGSRLSLTATATQDIAINPVADVIAANNDYNTVDIDYAYNPVCTGNVLSNDRDPDTYRYAGPESSLVVLEVDGEPTNGGTITVQGQYGTLVIKADGSYTYTLDNTLDAVQELQPGDSLTESFAYTAKSAQNAGNVSLYDDATLTIVISPTGRVPDGLTNNDTGETKAPIDDGAGGSGLQGLKDSEVDKPVISTVNNAATESHAAIGGSIDRLNNHLNTPVLPKSMDSQDILFHSSWSLDEPMLFGNTHEKSVKAEEEHVVSLPADLFVHTIAGERLTYLAMRPNGSGLPEWIVFNPDTFCLTCTPPPGSEGSVEVLIKAEDRRGLKAEAVVTIKIGEETEDGAVMAEGEPGAFSEQETAGDEETGGAPENGEEVAAVDEALRFAGEWLFLDGDAAEDAEAEAGTHPGLSNQIAATGSTALRAEARELLESLVGAE